MDAAAAKVQSKQNAVARDLVHCGLLSGETKVVFIIGDPIAQVKSPSILSQKFAEQGDNTLVIPSHIAAADVPAFMAGLQVIQNSDGLIITVPHKQHMMDFCDRMTDRAVYAGSVNVMRRVAGHWVGDNTDGLGYVNGVRAQGGRIDGARVLLIGAGGAGCAIGYEFLAQGASELWVHDVDQGRRDGYIARLTPAFEGRVFVGSNDPTGFDIVANATPLGMNAGDPLPVQVDKLVETQFAACPITKPEISPFIAAARSKGCGTMPGIGMFQAQADLLIHALQTLK